MYQPAAQNFSDYSPYDRPASPAYRTEDKSPSQRSYGFQQPKAPMGHSGSQTPKQPNLGSQPMTRYNKSTAEAAKPSENKKETTNKEGLFNEFII